jgi:uncharacterized protein involved in tolerance to divalent cations
MKTVIYILLVLLTLSSCSVVKKQSKQTYTWEGKTVTKKEYYRYLKKHNDDFIKNYKPVNY